jgi:outer membrane protein, heavy metal efflux system
MTETALPANRPRQAGRGACCALGFAGGLLAVLLAGCAGRVQPSERAARDDLAAVAGRFRPEGRPPDLPALTTNAGLADFLAFAMLSQPKVEAAYFEWAASIERVTVERSLPDPRLTFKTDIQDAIVSLIPGLMADFPGPGKLRARAEVASAESRARYYAFETALLQTAFDVKRAYYRVHFLEDKVELTRKNLGLLAELEQLARAQNEVGKVTLQDVLRAQIEQDRMRADLANLEDSRHPLLAQLKGALGLPAEQPDPPLPARFESTPIEVTPEQLFALALARNPRLKAMEAEVQFAEAGLRLARKSRVPDFAAGLEVDAKASPVIVTPQFSATLPIWRDKIAAEIAAAQGRRRAAGARLTAEQIMLAVDFADKLFSFREAGRNLTLTEELLLPKARLSLEVARAGYLSGKIDFLNLIDAQRTLLAFQLAAVEARTQRELVLAELSLLLAGQPPAEAPILGQPARPGPNSNPTAAQ